MIRLITRMSGLDFHTLIITSVTSRIGQISAFAFTALITHFLINKCACAPRPAQWIQSSIIHARSGWCGIQCLLNCLSCDLIIIRFSGCIPCGCSVITDCLRAIQIRFWWNLLRVIIVISVFMDFIFRFIPERTGDILGLILDFTVIHRFAGSVSRLFTGTCGHCKHHESRDWRGDNLIEFHHAFIISKW